MLQLRMNWRKVKNKKLMMLKMIMQMKLPMAMKMHVARNTLGTILRMLNDFLCIFITYGCVG